MKVKLYYINFLQMKTYLKLLLLCALFYSIGQPRAVAVTQTVTICDGTIINGYVPFYLKSPTVSNTSSQFVYSKDVLNGLPSGAKIKSIEFFANNYISTNTASVNVTIKMLNTSDLVVADKNAMDANRSNGSQVFSGTISANGNSMSLVFSCSEFKYTGQNLLIDTKQNNSVNLEPRHGLVFRPLKGHQFIHMVEIALIKKVFFPR